MSNGLMSQGWTRLKDHFKRLSSFLPDSLNSLLVKGSLGEASYFTDLQVQENLTLPKLAQQRLMVLSSQYHLRT
jgi:hypothetical protein